MMETDTAAHLSRRQVIRAFKMRGLSLQSAALEAMMNVLQRESSRNSNSSSSSSSSDVLNAILDEIRERILSARSQQQQSIVTKGLLAEVVADMSRDGRDVHEEALQLLDAYDTPRLEFDTMRKQFSLLTSHSPDNEPRSFFGDANSKVDMFAQRFALVQQRILRQDLFRPKLVTADGTSASADGRNVTHTITPVESLLGRTGVKFLLGMIVQVEEGRYYLEDSTAQVPLDLSETLVLTDGFITENCIVLVEGEMVDGTLHVHRMGNPIVETRYDATDTIGLVNSDLFHSMSTMAEVEKLREQEEQHGPDGMFVILSDVHLDKPSVLEKLETLLRGFQDMDPLPVFVLMGNFRSTKVMADPKLMMGSFDELAHAICKFPRLQKEARFVFVPGPNDVGMADILPRPPLPKYVTGPLRSKLSHAHFGTNPCRIRHFSKELVFFRQDAVHKLRRQCILKPRSGEAWVQHAVKTVLDQGHLCPMPLASCPIYWEFDHALRLYPLPDALVMGDCVDQYYENYAECDAINPGPFSKDFSFVVYRPVASVDEGGQTRSDVEFSQIEKDVVY